MGAPKVDKGKATGMSVYTSLAGQEAASTRHSQPTGDRHKEEKMVEPQESDLIDLPDYERIEDETFPPFPPPASLEREGGDGAEPDEDEVGENNDHDVSATELDPFLTNSSESAKFASESNLLVNTPSAQTAEGGNPGEDQEEEESDGFNRDLDSPHVDAAADPVNEEEELKIEKTQLDQSC
ncbi:hypothetical protein CB1_000715033 [Camelus ferus]|nr:hypothetical protein CB1_000715033 [Camelus ferus]